MQMTGEENKSACPVPLAGIGCHGYFHNDLGRIAPEAARNELPVQNNTLKISRSGKWMLSLSLTALTTALVTDAKQAGLNGCWYRNCCTSEDARR